MKNPNSPWNRLKRALKARWSSEDYPGAEPRFQVALFAKDIAIFILLPVGAIIFYKAIENGASPPRRPIPNYKSSEQYTNGEARSQIIEFHNVGPSNGSSGAALGFGRRSPGSLVRVKLLNVVETYSNAPVHAQIIDRGLGDRLMGGTLIGDAIPDPNFERINITFKYARDPNRDAVAAQLSARALSLDGTLGLEGHKKEGFVTRSFLGSTQTTTQEAQGKSNSTDLKDILFRALSVGLVQELGSGAQVEKNRAQVLSLSPSTEFFAELTDFFPGNSK